MNENQHKIFFQLIKLINFISNLSLLYINLWGGGSSISVLNVALQSEHVRIFRTTQSTLYFLFFLHVHKPITSCFTLFKLIFLFSLYCVVQHVRECIIYNDLISVRSLQLKLALNVWAKLLIIVGL